MRPTLNSTDSRTAAWSPSWSTTQAPTGRNSCRRAAGIVGVDQQAADDPSSYPPLTRLARYLRPAAPPVPTGSEAPPGAEEWVCTPPPREARGGPGDAPRPAGSAPAGSGRDEQRTSKTTATTRRRRPGGTVATRFAGGSTRSVVTILPRLSIRAASGRRPGRPSVAWSSPPAHRCRRRDLAPSPPEA